MSIVRKGILSVAGAGVLAAANLGVGVLLARWLSPEGLGQYALLASTATLLGVFGSLGMGGACIYFVNNQGMELRAATTAAVRTAVTIGLALGVSAAMAVQWEGYFGVLPTAAAAAVGLMVLGKVVVPATILLLMAAMRVLKYVVIQVTPSLALLFLLALLALSDRLTLGPALWAAAVGQLLAVVILLSFLRKDFAMRRPFRWAELRPLLSYGLLINVAHFTYIAGMDGGLFIMRVFTPEFAEVGFYQAAMRLGSLLVLAVMALGPVLFSKYSASDEVSRHRHVERTSRVFWMGVLALVVVMEFAARPMVLLLFGSAFEPAVLVLQIMVLGMGARALVSPMLQMFFSVGAPGWVAAILGLNVLVMVGLMYVLVPAQAAVGGALSFVAANAVALVVGYAVATARYDIKLRECFVITGEDVRFVIANLRAGSGATWRSA